MKTDNPAELNDPCIGCPYYYDCPDDNPYFDFDKDVFPSDAKCLSEDK